MTQFSVKLNAHAAPPVLVRCVLCMCSLGSVCVCVFAFVSVCMSVSMSVCVSVCLCVCLTTLHYASPHDLGSEPYIVLVPVLKFMERS